MFKKICIFVLFLVPTLGYTATFSGVVKDEQGETLPGANIVSITNSETGCATNFDGVFSCTKMPDDGQVSVSYVGYESLIITLKPSETNDVVLKESSNTLEDVIVTPCDKEVSTWDAENKTCKCNNENYVWNKDNQTCEKKQPSPKENPDKSLCEKQPGTWDEENKNCKCKDSNAKWNQDTKKCETEQKKGKKQPDEEKLNEAKEEYENAKANEQSTANKTLTALTTAATGIGGMELARGLTEQKADKEAEQNMDAHIATMRCEYGNGKSVKVGTAEIELPGGNDPEMMKLRNEYLTLAQSLKELKEALGMKPGIESEVVLDKAQVGLYDDENTGITNGAYASLYRAKMGNETDQAKLQEMKDTSKKRVVGGAIAVAAGTVIGIAGNVIINKKSKQQTEYQENYLNLSLSIDELKSISSKTSDTLKLDTAEMLDMASAISEYTNN